MASNTERHTKENNRRNAGFKKSAYEQLIQTLEDVKAEKISVRTAMHKLQFRDRPERPYAKVTKMGAVALYGITKEPIVLYEAHWNRLIKTVESGYLTRYMEYNAHRISHEKSSRRHGEAEAEATGVASVLASVPTEEVAADPTA